MRSLRTTLTVATLLGIAPALAGAQREYTAKDLLRLSPILKTGVEYETPTDPAVINACKVEIVYNAQKRPIGHALRDGQGKLLRKFVDSDGDPNRVMDQWSFYQDGFEVYRESDKNNDKSPEECRWLNSAGTRVGVMAGGKITGWKRISAEEASKVLVQALVGRDLALLETVLATPEELRQFGIPKEAVEQAAAAAPQRVEKVNGLLKGLTGWTSQFVWNRFDGTMPHVIAADPDTGLTQDLVLYENAMIFAGPSNGQFDPNKDAFLRAPEMVKIGEAWKFAELPHAIAPGKPVMASNDEGIRSWIFRGQVGGAAVAQNPEVDAALKGLAKYDMDHADVLAGGDKKAIAQYHVGRVPLLGAVVKVAKGDDQLSYKKQIIDSLVAAFQTGLYPNGVTIIDRVVAEDQGHRDKLESYAAFRKIAADFALESDKPGANALANQKKWMGDLKGFLDNAKYSRSDEAPEALLPLASGYEFNFEEDEARTYYTRLAKEFPATEPGKKAAGALRRLDLVGKPLVLKGTGLKNEEIDSTQYRGKVLLVTFWAAFAGKRDLPELARVYQKYRPGGFEIVGVSLDSEKGELDAFLKENPIAWPLIFEPGGMDSRLGTEFGIISLPTMILVDKQGKVLNRNIRTAAELERQLEQVLAGQEPGVALGEK